MTKVLNRKTGDEEMEKQRPPTLNMTAKENANRYEENQY